MRWQTARGVRFCLPEIVDYEVRRELLRAISVQGLARLDLLKSAIWYLPITTQSWRKRQSSGRMSGGADAKR